MKQRVGLLYVHRNSTFIIILPPSDIRFWLTLASRLQTSLYFFIFCLRLYVPNIVLIISCITIKLLSQNCKKLPLLTLSCLSVCLSVCLSLSLSPSFCMEQLGSHWKDFHESRRLSIFRKSVEKIQFSLKCDRNNGYFRWRSIYIYLYHTLSVLLRMRNVSSKAVDKIKPHFIFYNFTKKNLAVFWDNVGNYCSTGQATDDNMAHARYLLGT